MKKIKLTGNNIFSEAGRFESGVLYIVGETIVTEPEFLDAVAEEVVLDAGDDYVIPGLTDIHFHGCVGYDCCDASVEAFQKMAVYEASQGITSITPATMTMPAETLFSIMKAAAELKENTKKADGTEGKAADFCGLYMEGPFISVKKKGAQKAEYVIEADSKLFEQLQEASGNQIRTVIVAPETQGAMEFIRAEAGKLNISLGHMMADYDTAKEALENGASQITHLFNAMPPLTHREPGPAGAAADDPDCMVELICDGVHIHPAMVRTVFRLFGADRVIMISDSMRAAGMPDGEYELGGQAVFVKGREAVLKDGTLAGSVTNLMDCVRTVVKEMGIPLESAVKCAAVNPAKAIGIYDRYGSLTPGKTANIVLLDEELKLKQVFIHGKQ